MAPQTFIQKKIFLFSEEASGRGILKQANPFFPVRLLLLRTCTAQRFTASCPGKLLIFDHQPSRRNTDLFQSKLFLIATLSTEKLERAVQEDT